MECWRIVSQIIKKYAYTSDMHKKVVSIKWIFIIIKIYVIYDKYK